MRSLSCLIILFIVISCSNSKNVYWCGDHPCINKKEKEAYFKKTLIVEIRELNKSTTINKSEIEKITHQIKRDEKKRIQEEKDLAKQIKRDEKKRIQEEKDLKKQIKKNEKKIIKNEKKTSKQIVSTSSGLRNITNSPTKFNELVEEIIKKNTFRPYPNINDIPN